MLNQTLKRLLALLVGLSLPALAAPLTVGGLNSLIYIPYIPVCSTPTLALCQNTTFLSGSCGGSRCTAILQAEYNRQNDALPGTRSALVPTNLSGANTYTTAKTRPYNYASHYQYGGYRTYASNATAAQLSLLKSGGSIFAIDPHGSWKGNGSRVESCEEMVFDRWRSMADFEDSVASYGNDYTQIFVQAMWGANALANRPLRDTAGRDLGPFPFPNKPRNPYFTRLDLRMPYGQGSSAIEGSWGAFVNGTPYRTWSWSEHESAFWYALGTYGEDKLEREYGLAMSHVDLVRARTDAWTQYESQWNKKNCNAYPWRWDCSALASDYGTKLHDIDFGIAVSLYNAYSRGCMSTSGPLNACDWSPHFFYDQLEQNIAVDRETQLNRCLTMTHNDFSTGIVGLARSPSGFWSEGRQIIAGADWTSDPGQLIMLFALIDNYARGIEVPIDPATRKATAAKASSDAQLLGNENFGVYYSYEAGWGVDGLQTALCQADLHAKAAFNADAKIIGTSTNLITALGEVRTEPYNPYAPSTVTFDMQRKLQVLGSDIIVAPSMPGSIEVSPQPVINLSVDYALYTPQTELGRVYIVVLGVPVKLAGGVSGSVGLNASMNGSMERHCGATNGVGFALNGTAKPFAGVDAWASASVDAGIIEIGVEGRVMLIKFGLPLSIGVATEIDTRGSLNLRATSSLKLEFETLSGSITLFARVLFKSFETELISWNGPKATTTLWEFNYDPAVSLPALQLALNIMR